MAYDFVVSRIGATAAKPIFEDVRLGQHGGQLIETFTQQIDALSGLLEKKGGANELVLTIANDEFRAAANDITAECVDDNFTTVFGMPPEAGTDADSETLTMDERGDVYDTLVGSARFQKIQCKLDGQDWILRSRVSATACALQSGTRQTKLWLTLDGIPMGKKLVEEAQVAKFNALVNRLEAELIPVLGEYYVTSLKTATKRPARFEIHPERIRISLADNDTPPVVELADALTLYKQPLSAIQEPLSKEMVPAHEGLLELEKFAGHVSGDKLNITTETIHVEKNLDVVGIYGRQEDIRSYAALIAGFARRTGGGSGFGVRLEPLERFAQEKWVRRVSPSRQLSAQLATNEARKLERRLGLQ